MKNERGSSLQGKVVVILGGTSGIGLETAVATSDEGLKLLPSNSRGLTADLTDEAQIR